MVTPIQPSWLAVFLVSNDSRGLKFRGSGQSQSVFLQVLRGRMGDTGDSYRQHPSNSSHVHASFTRLQGLSQDSSPTKSP